MKVVLVNPSSSVSISGYAHAPLGLAYIAAALLKKGHDVEIVDFGFEMDLNGFYNKLKETKPDVVGITCMTPQVSIALRIAKIIKRSVDCPLIFGGPHATILPESLLDEADYIVEGEGEVTICELLQSLEGRMDIENVKGIWYKKDGTAETLHDLSDHFPGQ